MHIWLCICLLACCCMPAFLPPHLPIDIPFCLSICLPSDTHSMSHCQKICLPVHWTLNSVLYSRVTSYLPSYTRVPYTPTYLSNDLPTFIGAHLPIHRLPTNHLSTHPSSIYLFTHNPTFLLYQPSDLGRPITWASCLTFCLCTSCCINRGCRLLTPACNSAFVKPVMKSKPREGVHIGRYSPTQPLVSARCHAITHTHTNTHSCTHADTLI